MKNMNGDGRRAAIRLLGGVDYVIRGCGNEHGGMVLKWHRSYIWWFVGFVVC